MKSALFVVLLLLAAASAKRRKAAGHSQVTQRKRECDAECSSAHEDERANCALRCQSEACYEEIYMPEELEPGEIDVARSRAFQSCTAAESRNQRVAAVKKRVKVAEPADGTLAADESRVETGGSSEQQPPSSNVEL